MTFNSLDWLIILCLIYHSLYIACLTFQNPVCSLSIIDTFVLCLVRSHWHFVNWSEKNIYNRGMTQKWSVIDEEKVAVKPDNNGIMIITNLTLSESICKSD